MKRKLKFDPGFKPIIYTGDREREYFPNGIFLFDITGLDDHIKAHQEEFTPIDVEVNRYYSDDSIMGVKELKEEHIEAADLNRPILFVEIAPDRYELGTWMDQAGNSTLSGAKTALLGVF